MTEPSFAPWGLGKGVNRLPLHVNDRRDHKLGDAVASANHKRFPAEVEQDDMDLSAVVGVDGARGVEKPDPVAHRQPAARPDLPFIPLGKGDPDAGGDSGKPARGEGKGFDEGGRKVVAGGGVRKSLGQREILVARGAKDFDGDR